MADETVAKNWSPAFPLTVESPDGSVTTFQGMTLRDWFAGQAMTSLGTWMPDLSYDGVHAGLTSVRVLDARAKWAYAQADAMLKARGNG